MKNIFIHSFLALNLVISTKQCFASGWFSGWFETTEQKLARDILEGNNTPLLNIMEEQRDLIKTKSQKPINTARKQNAATFSISATAIRESSSSQKEYKEKNNGCDGRRKIEKTDEWPYSVHGAVFATFQNSIEKWGTGTLISPNLVLTAAHNLYDMDYDIEKMREATKVEFCPAMNGDKIFFGKIEIIKHYFPEEYKISGDTSFDYGLLVLDRPVGQETGYFGLGIISEDKLKSSSINVTGYPGDKVLDKSGFYEMWTMEGPIKNIQDGLINYTINTYCGQSGAGIWYQDGENYLVAGVHVKGAKDFNKDFNSAILLTRSRYDQITSWIKDSILKGIAKNIFGELFTNVKEIDLGHKLIDNMRAKLFTSDRFPCLTRLDLRYNEIRSEGAQTLAQNTTLTQLDLSRNSIGDIGAQALAQNTTLTQLDLSYNIIGYIGAQALAQNTTLTQLSLNYNRIDDIGVQALAQNTTLTQLDLPWNNISDIGAQAIAQNTTLTQLGLSHNGICDIGAQALAQNTTLTQLDLAWNYISDIGAQALAHNTTLTQLSLRYNVIGYIGAQALAANNSLKILYLEDNNIGDIGAQALAHNTTLTQLNLNRNKIGDIGAQALAANNSLKILYLEDNNIGDIGAQALAQNTTLTQLNLRDNFISNAGIKALHANRKITVNTEDQQSSCLIQ